MSPGLRTKIQAKVNLTIEWLFNFRSDQNFSYFLANLLFSTLFSDVDIEKEKAIQAKYENKNFKYEDLQKATEK